MHVFVCVQKQSFNVHSAISFGKSFKINLSINKLVSKGETQTHLVDRPTWPLPLSSLPLSLTRGPAPSASLRLGLSATAGQSQARQRRKRLPLPPPLARRLPPSPPVLRTPVGDPACAPPAPLPPPVDRRRRPAPSAALRAPRGRRAAGASSRCSTKAVAKRYPSA